MSPVTTAITSAPNAVTSWQQVKQEAVTTATSKPTSLMYFPTKAFVKASSTPQGKKNGSGLA